MSVKYNTSFLVDQIAGSCALEGVTVTSEEKDKLASIIEGKLSASEAKDALITRHKEKGYVEFKLHAL